MARTQTLVQLTDELIGLLDQEAAERGLSRSALIRDVLADHLHDRREAELARRIVEGYERMPPGRPDEWGDLEAMGDRTRLALDARLDEEERRAGHEPW